MLEVELLAGFLAVLVRLMALILGWVLTLLLIVPLLRLVVLSVRVRV
jgi:hypothetical protein